MIRGTSSYLECLDSHREVVLLPHSHVHLSILASSQLVLHGDVCALHLPLVVDGRHTVHCGLVAFGCWVVQGGDQAIGYSGVMVDELGQGGEAALGRHIHLRGEAWRWVKTKERMRRRTELINAAKVRAPTIVNHFKFFILPFHQRMCWSGSGRLSPHSGEKWTAVRGCSRFPGPGNCRWWGTRAGTLRRCVTRAHGTSYASPDCLLAWCSWRAPNPGRS